MAEKWLVIDDSATIQRVIKLAFQDYDVLITEADSVQEALRELVSTPSSLVIVDAALAGVQSVHDFSKLPQSSPNSAFVILEGSYDHIDENQFRGAGFRYFLKKPFDAAQLIAITREALGRPIPHRYKDNEKITSTAARTRSPFALVDEPKEPAPIPTVQVQPQSPAKPSRSYLDDFTNTGYSAPESFDLGLDYFSDHKEEEKPEAKAQPKVEPTRRPESFGIDPFEALAFSADQFKAKPYHPEPQVETRQEPEAEPARAERSSPSLAAAPLELPADEHELDEGYGRNEREGVQAQASEDNSYIASPLSGMLEPMLQEEMGKLVRQSVEEYCRKHFAELAREFLMREIDKLSQERSRLLVDK